MIHLVAIRPDLAAVAGLGLVAGVLIGCIGVGGVIIVPVMVEAGYSVATAISVAMAGYILTGIVGTAVFLRRGTLDVRLAAPLCVGAMPAAVAGALAAKVTPAPVLELVIAVMTAGSGVDALLRGRGVARQSRSPRALPRAGWAGLGCGAGFVSSLTGTGGPAALIPLLLWLDIPALTIVGLAQVIQLPIAVLATASNVATGGLDLALGAALGIGLTAGARVGVELAHSLDQRLLRALVAVTLAGVGLAMLARAIASWRL